MKYRHVQSFPDSKVRSLFGLSKAQLGELSAIALPVICERRHNEQWAKPDRMRAPGAGAKRCLTPLQELLLCLVYLRHNVAHSVCGELFGVSADKSENVFHEVIQVLAQVCPSDRWNAEKYWKKGEPSWHPADLDYVLVDSFETPVCIFRAKPNTDSDGNRTLIPG